jgi:glycine/D-amino acid oxidase-like deaminating enzyme
VCSSDLGSVHSGYTSGPYIAKLLAEQMLGRDPDLSLRPFDVARLIVRDSVQDSAA